jgi:hypothetical protein
MSYVDRVRADLLMRLPSLEPALLDLYALLALVKGDQVTLEDVHDAWALWRSRSNPHHKSLIPFDQLADEVQALDQRYADAIAEASRG